MDVVITAEEKRRIEALDLAGDPEVGAKPWFAVADRRSGEWRLKHRPGGGCVFLTTQGRCRIHERFGADVKPFVCRLFPFVLVPAGDHWRVSLRFSCPSAAANQGQPVVDAETELAGLARSLEQHVGKSAQSAPPPFLHDGQQLSWPDFLRVVQVMVEIVQDRKYRLERRLRICLAVASVCRKTQFDQLQGNKLTKYLHAVRSAMETEIPREPGDFPPPDPLFGRLLFRVMLAIFASKDRRPRGAIGIGKRLRRVSAAWRFAKGSGRVPRINDRLPDVDFEKLEEASPVPLDVDETLERYYLVKLNALDFCGAPNFDLPLCAGLESLVLTLPMILWIRRALTDSHPVDAVQQAIQLVDDHFGTDPMLRFPHIQYLIRTIADRGELEKLVAWYSR
jgi:lysine-N-methylase